MNRITLIAGAALLAAFGIGGWFILSQDDAPQESAGHSMTPPDTSSVGDGAAIVQVQLSSELSPEAQIGKRGFEAICAECHGVNAAGRNGMGPPLVHRIYEPSHHGDGAFQVAVMNGVRAHHWNFGNMPPVEGLTQADVANITTYVRELQQANGIR